MEKETWYKDTKHDEPEADSTSPAKYIKTNSGARKSMKSKPLGGKKKVKSVIFVPHTTNSGLARNLREKENELEKVTGDRIKIVEKSGTKLEDILTKTDPWKGTDCGRQNCIL